MVFCLECALRHVEKQKSCRGLKLMYRYDEVSAACEGLREQPAGALQGMAVVSPALIYSRDEQVSQHPTGASWSRPETRCIPHDSSCAQAGLCGKVTLSQDGGL